MYNTPASRTSKHGSSKKQRRAKQSQSRPATPVTIPVLPEPVEEPMYNALEAKEEGGGEGALDVVLDAEPVQEGAADAEGVEGLEDVAMHMDVPLAEEYLNEPLDKALETKEERIWQEPEGALDVFLDAEPMQEGGGGAEGVDAAEVGASDEMDTWFTEAMAAPPVQTEQQHILVVSPDVHPEDLQESEPEDVEDDGVPEHLQHSTAFKEPARSVPAELASMPDQVNEDLLLSINVGAERAVEDHRTVEHATSPVRNDRDAVDKPNTGGNGGGNDVEFPPALLEANVGHVRAPIIAR